MTTLLAGGVSFWKCPMRTFLIHLLDTFDARISGELCTCSEEEHLPIYLRAFFQKKQLSSLVTLTAPQQKRLQQKTKGSYYVLSIIIVPS